VKVVGSVIRLSIGFQTKWGHRRQNVSLSYQHIQNYSHLKDRKTLSQSIRVALGHNYIERVERGYFDPNAGKLSRAAVYAREVAQQSRGSNDRSEIPTGKKQDSQSVRKPHRQRLEIPTGRSVRKPHRY
jgi:hypothetical protein